MGDRTELNVLNHLFEVCRDGEHGFEFAASHAVDPDIKDLFTTLADERRRYADELLPHVHRLGGQANTPGTNAGTIHRGWMALKNAITQHHEDVLVAEAERGDRAAARAYKDALAGMLPPTVSELIEKQYLGICGAHERMVSLASARNIVA